MFDRKYQLITVLIVLVVSGYLAILTKRSDNVADLYFPINTSQTDSNLDFVDSDRQTFLQAAQFVDKNAPKVFGSDYPDNIGALSVNRKTGKYSSVRWQMEIYSLTVRALTNNKDEDINNLSRSIKYSFDHQLNDGSFEFAPPANLTTQQKSPNEGDLASATSFFLAALGNSLNLMNENQEILKNSDSGTNLLKELSDLKPKFELSLEWLESKSEILKRVDSKAPNRLLFNSLAFYGLGKYLQNTEAKSLGLEFMDQALKLQNQAGIFDENGFDSSYQAVNIVNLQHLYFLIKRNENLDLENRVLNSIKIATYIELTKILPSGEILTKGNGRVFDGGEKFLGQEKQIAVQSVVQAFGYSAYIFKDKSYQETAVKIYRFYQSK